MKDSLIYLVKQLLIKNKIAFDREELAFQIQSHPSYPSLHAITGVLDHFNIENIAAEVTVDATTLEQLPDCFIAQVNTGKGQQLSTVKKNKADFTVFYSSKEKEKLSETDFLDKFTGIIVAVEKLETQEIAVNHSKTIKNIGILVTSIVLGIFVITNTPSIGLGSFLILSIVGLFISIAILKQELGLSTAIGDTFCSNIDDKKDCDAVLTSKGATIIGNYKLSDFGLLYFSGLSLLTLALIANQEVNLIVLSVISLLALPITLYSIYYQFAIVKKWCLLCLSTVAVLWGLAAITFYTSSSFGDITFKSALLLLLSFVIVFSIWQYLKPMLLSAITLKKEKIEFVKFKRNFSLFKTVLQKSATVNTEIQHIDEVVFGNPKAKLELTIITNPFCGHCKPVHQLIENILDKYAEKLQITVRFNINTANEESNGVLVSSRILQLYDSKGEKQCLNAMHDIYGGMSTEKWLEKWGDCSDSEKYTAILTSESNWCKEKGINFTPEVLVNGKSFPKEYQREDLIFFIEELEEESSLAITTEELQTTI